MDLREAYDDYAVADYGVPSGDAQAHFLSFGARGSALLLQLGLNTLGIDAETIEPRAVVTFHDTGGIYGGLNEEITGNSLRQALHSRDRAQVLLLPGQTGNMVYSYGDIRLAPGFIQTSVETDAVIAAQAIAMARLANAGKLNFWVPYNSTYTVDTEHLTSQLGGTDTRVYFASPNSRFFDRQEIKFQK